MSVELHLGDCLEVMKSMPDKSVDAIITDPPYGIGLDEWDKEINISEFMREAKRITKNFLSYFGQMPTIANCTFKRLRLLFTFLRISFG